MSEEPRTYFTEMVDTADLHADTNSVKTHPPDQVARIAGLIREFGFTSPLLVDEENFILAGRGRWLAAQTLGLQQLPCVRVTGLTPARRRALIIADNKVAESDWEREALRAEMEAIMAEDEDVLGLTGFDFEEIDDILKGALAESCDDGEDIPKIRFLSVGKHKIELTPGEEKALSGICSAWSKSQGSYRGLVADMLLRLAEP